MTPLPVLDAETVSAGPAAATSLRSRQTELESPEVQRRLLDNLSLEGGPTGTAAFGADLATTGWGNGLSPAPLEIFQINVGKLCNMTCRHCHVDAGPDRTDEIMTRETAEACVAAIDRMMSRPEVALHTIDITGGAPELNPRFEYLVESAVERGLHVIDRSNLTILLTRPHAHLPAWLSERKVEVAASFPHFRRTGTDAQRGDGAFEKSIEAVQRLNEVGYGKGDPDRVLTLVTNPVGAFIPANQDSLEREWKAELSSRHGVTFDRLFTITNMPIARYLEWLEEKGQTEAYLERLLEAFNPAAVDGLMCRNTVSVSWDGRLYDCDFNQMLELEADIPEPTVQEFDLDAWQARQVVTARHCYGCTAGAGSSCGGATT